MFVNIIDITEYVKKSIPEVTEKHVIAIGDDQLIVCLEPHKYPYGRQILIDFGDYIYRDSHGNIAGCKLEDFEKNYKKVLS